VDRLTVSHSSLKFPLSFRKTLIVFTHKIGIMSSLLVVDDATYMRRLIGIMAKKGGHTIVGEAETGVKAIELYTHLKPDLVILDILMPDMNGLEVLRQIKKLNADARILMCTASEQSAHVKDALDNGAAGYIVKPFTQEELTMKITDALA
jgi:two-component system chemotaxis response regulator CheY